MTRLDWVITAVVVISVVLAAAQGFFVEIFSLVGVVLGYMVAAWQYPRVAALYAPYVKSDWVAEFAGFFTIFLGVVLLAGIVGRIVRWTFKEAGLRWFDRLLGGAFGLVRGLAITAVALLAVTSFAPDSPWLARSTFGPYLLMGARGAVYLAPAKVRERFHAGLLRLRQERVQTEAATTPGGATR